MQLQKPGEFTMRAFINKKLDLIQAEGINDLIKSSTKKQADLALNQITGNISSKYLKIKKDLIKLSSFIEAYLDFPEEELNINIFKEIETLTLDLKKDLNIFLKKSEEGEIIKNGVKVAIIGPPNVGKSSLINHFSQKELAIVSNISGTTRDILESQIDYKGYLFIFKDTAGIRDKAKNIEKIGIEKSLKEIKSSNIRCFMIDYSSVGFLTKNIELIKNKDYNQHNLILINKLDKKRVSRNLLKK